MIAWLERKAGWIAFPSIIRYLAFFQLGMVGLTFLNPKAIQLIEFSWPEILKGEYWRLFSFIFVPIGSLNGGGGSMVAIFAVFAALIMMRFSDGIEERLGAFRTTLYFLFGWFMCAAASVVFNILPIGSLGVSPSGEVYSVTNLLSPETLFGASILFAFATFHPRFTLLLFFVLPVQIWILAAVTGVMFILNASVSLGAFLYLLLALSHYLVMILPNLKTFKKARVNKVVSKVKPLSAPVSFHVCEVCGKKDSDDPKAYFRVTGDGRELCDSCLNDIKKP